MRKGAALLIVILFIAIFGAVMVTATRAGLLNGIFTNNSINAMIAEEASQAGLEAGLLYYKNSGTAAQTLCVDLDSTNLSEIVKTGNCGLFGPSRPYAKVQIAPAGAGLDLVSITSIGYYGAVTKKHSLTKEATALAASATGPCQFVSFHDWSDYGGRFVCLPNGTYNIAAVRGFSLNDVIASIKISGQYKTTVWTDSLSGNYLIVSANLKNLDYVSGGGQGRWDDTISSMKVEPSTECGIAIYTGANYGNNGVCLPEGNYANNTLMFNTDPAHEPTISDNSISSIKVMPGHTATIYTAKDFGVGAGMFQRVITPGDNTTMLSLQNLRQTGVCSGQGHWNDCISSIVVN